MAANIARLNGLSLMRGAKAPSALSGKMSPDTHSHSLTPYSYSMHSRIPSHSRIPLHTPSHTPLAYTLKLSRIYSRIPSHSLTHPLSHHPTLSQSSFHDDSIRSSIWRSSFTRPISRTHPCGVIYDIIISVAVISVVISGNDAVSANGCGAGVNTRWRACRSKVLATL